MKLKYGVLFSSALVFAGCGFTPGLPDQVQDFTKYVVTEIEKAESLENNQSSSNHDWLSQNYPANCDWHEFKRVVDGDTIIVNKNDRIRMIGIDTPESKKEGTAVQPFSLDATRKLKSILDGSQKVCLIKDAVGDEVDIYGRWLRYVISEDGVDANYEMIKAGLAEGYFRFSFDRKSEFQKLESEIKSQGIGIWE